MSSENVLHLKTENFTEEALNASVPVLVDFWAPWCGPCRMLGPVIDELAADFINNAKVCKVNVDDEGALGAQYGVMSIPTIIVLKDGKEVNRFVGVTPKETLSEAITALL